MHEISIIRFKKYLSVLKRSYPTIMRKHICIVATIGEVDQSQLPTNHEITIHHRKPAAAELCVNMKTFEKDLFHRAPRRACARNWRRKSKSASHNQSRDCRSRSTRACILSRGAAKSNSISSYLLFPTELLCVARRTVPLFYVSPFLGRESLCLSLSARASLFPVAGARAASVVA